MSVDQWAQNALDEEAVLTVLRREGVPLKNSEIAEWVKPALFTTSRSRRALLRLAEVGKVVLNKNGYWELTDAAGS